MKDFYQIIIQPKVESTELLKFTFDNISIENMAHFYNDIEIMEKISELSGYPLSAISMCIFEHMSKIIDKAIEMRVDNEKETEERR